MIKNILAILISIGILFFSLKDFIYTAISIIAFFSLSYYLCDVILQLSKKTVKKMRRIKYLEYLFLFAIIPFLVFGRHFENTIGGYELFWKLIFVSLICTCISVFLLNYFCDFFADNKRDRIFSICILYFLLIPAIGILINQKIITSEINKEIVEIVEKDFSVSLKSSSETYYIFIKTKFDKERLEVTKELYDSVSDYQYFTVKLTLVKGFLGYDYVKKIEIH